MYFIIEYELNNKKIDLNNMTDSNNITCIVLDLDIKQTVVHSNQKHSHNPVYNSNNELEVIKLLLT